MFTRIISILLFFTFAINSYSTELSNLIIEEHSKNYFVIKKLLSTSGAKIAKQLSPKRILFLGDQGSKYSNAFSLAEAYGLSYKKMGEEVDIFKSDISCQDLPYDVDSNIIEMNLDHNATFPFVDNYFDIIIGGRILCQCNKMKLRKTCGGLDLDDSPGFQSFFTEISRVLNKNNPNSFALIHGSDRFYSEEESEKTFNEISLACFASAQRFPCLAHARNIFIDYAYSEHITVEEYQCRIVKRYAVYIGNVSIDSMEDL